MGVLHKDVKPANVLVTPQPDGGWQIKIADFGCGSLMEPSRLDVLGIKNLGFTQTATSEAKTLTGTLMYMAPEVITGQSPTASADIYALGVMLYQLAVGDFSKPLSPGWEAGIEDPLIREDIAAAACGDPARRLPGAAALIERLESLDRRRLERNELDLARQRAQVAERRLAEARARRPWVVAAVLVLVAGLAVRLLSMNARRRFSCSPEDLNRRKPSSFNCSVQPWKHERIKVDRRRSPDRFWPTRKRGSQRSRNPAKI